MSARIECVEVANMVIGLTSDKPIIISTYIPIDMVINEPFPRILPIVPDRQRTRFFKAKTATQFNDSDRFNNLDAFLKYVVEHEELEFNKERLLIDAAIEDLTKIDDRVIVGDTEDADIPIGIAVVKRVYNYEHH